MRRRTSLILILLVCLFGVVIAQKRGRSIRKQRPAVTTAEPREAAKQHYLNGRALYDQQDWDGAIKEFKTAYEIFPDAVFLYNIAHTCRLSKKYEQALFFYKSFLTRARGIPKATVTEVQGYISQLTELTKQQKTAQPRAPLRTRAPKYSAFLHSSEKHKSLACNACHKIPTAWNAKRDFPDAADFPDHDACVRCHRQQFFTRPAMIGTGPAICTVCHVRAAPREDGRFAFGRPNNSGQSTKPKEEWQFAIEFPHDKHQNVIASTRPIDPSTKKAVLAPARASAVSFMRAAFVQASVDDKKPDYNNCSICHTTNKNAMSVSPPGWFDSFIPPLGTFKTMPHSHDACFNCHWKNQKPASDDCAGCHKLSAAALAPVNFPKRISAKFNHDGGKENHFQECTTCHINITRASTLRGLTPDVPIAACTTCHKDNKKTTFPTAKSIEDEFAEYKKTSNCTYCHTSDVGKKNPPASHEAAAQ